jgi:hypothetical protein
VIVEVECFRQDSNQYEQTPLWRILPDSAGLLNEPGMQDGYGTTKAKWTDKDRPDLHAFRGFFSSWQKLSMSLSRPLPMNCETWT